MAGESRSELSCGNVSGVGAEKGNGVTRGRRRRSFKSSDASGKILDEVVIGKVAFGSGRFGRASGAKRGRGRERREAGRRGGDKRGGVVPPVKGRSVERM